MANTLLEAALDRGSQDNITGISFPRVLFVSRLCLSPHYCLISPTVVVVRFNWVGAHLTDQEANADTRGFGSNIIQLPDGDFSFHSPFFFLSRLPPTQYPLSLPVVVSLVAALLTLCSPRLVESGP